MLKNEILLPNGMHANIETKHGYDEDGNFHMAQCIYSKDVENIKLVCNSQAGFQCLDSTLLQLSSVSSVIYYCAHKQTLGGILESCINALDMITHQINKMKENVLNELIENDSSSAEKH